MSPCRSFIVYVPRLGRTEKVKRPRQADLAALWSVRDAAESLQQVVDENGEIIIPDIETTVQTANPIITVRPIPPELAATLPSSALDGVVTRCGSAADPDLAASFGASGFGEVAPIVVKKGGALSVLLRASFGRKPKLILDVVASAAPEVETASLKNHAKTRRQRRKSSTAALLGFDSIGELGGPGNIGSLKKKELNRRIKRASSIGGSSSNMPFSPLPTPGPRSRHDSTPW